MQGIGFKIIISYLGMEIKDRLYQTINIMIQ